MRLLFFCLTYFCLVAETTIKAHGFDGKYLQNACLHQTTLRFLRFSAENPFVLKGRPRGRPRGKKSRWRSNGVWTRAAGDNTTAPTLACWRSDSLLITTSNLSSFVAAGPSRSSWR